MVESRGDRFKVNRAMVYPMDLTVASQGENAGGKKIERDRGDVYGDADIDGVDLDEGGIAGRVRVWQYSEGGVEAGKHGSSRDPSDGTDRVISSETETLPLFCGLRVSGLIVKDRKSGGLTKNGGVDTGEEGLSSDRKDRESRERQHREREKRLVDQ
jgi:hypothetical protein